MRAKHLCRCGSLCPSFAALVLVLVLVAVSCRAPLPEPEPATATQAEVTNALYRQLNLVLERHDELVLSKSAAARREQEILVDLATEIAVRIVRIDPNARIDWATGG